MKKLLMMCSLSVILSVAAMGQDYEFGGSTAFGDGTGSGRGATASSVSGTFGNISFDVEEGMTLADLDTLSTDFQTDDGCAGGSPRFTVATEEGGLYDFWWTCTAGPNFQSTGDLTDGNVDVRGSHPFQYQASFSSVQTQFGTETIKSITLIVDGSWAFPDGSQVVTFDNVNVDGETFNFETPGSTTQCKNGGWQGFVNATGDPLYKNQGQCVAAIASGGKSGGKKN